MRNRFRETGRTSPRLSHPGIGRFALVAVAVLLAGTSLLVVSGCRASDALTEIIYTQDTDYIDYDNPQKYYINDPTSDEKSDQVSASEVAKNDQKADDTEQNLVVYSSNPNTDAYTAKKSAFSDNPDFTGIEASEKVYFYKSNDKDALDHTVTKKEQSDDTKQEQDDDAEATQAGTSGEIQAQDEEEGGGPNGETSVPEDSSDATSSTSTSDSDATAGRQARKVDPTRIAYDSSDPTQDPPSVSKVAAFGSYATIVELVAGKGALVATDAETLDSDFTKVFDTSGVKKGWSDSGSAKKMNVKQIVASGAQVILATNSSYLESLSDSDFGKISNAGIEVVVMRPMTCSQYIKSNVTTVGKMLDGSSDGEYAAQASERASDYSTFHDNLLSACISANGGSYAGTEVYQTGNKTDVSGSGTEADDSTYTLLVDAYDKNAKYTGASFGSANWTPSKGLAYASAGYSATPVSYYIQCGGLVNNAAALSSAKGSGKIPVLQFSKSQFSFASKNWSGISVTLLKDQAITNLDHPLLDSGKNSSNRTGLGSGLGTSSFPKLITTSASIKSSIMNDSEGSKGMYHPYSWVSASGSSRTIEAFGVNIGNAVLYSCVGVDGSASGSENDNTLGSSIPDSAIEVNPHGVFASWTEGGTVESFLEAAWVCDVVNENDDGSVDWEQEAKDFYSEFYGYDLKTSELTD